MQRIHTVVTNSQGRRDQMTAVHTLERDLYVVSDAARILGLRPQTLRNWLQGYSRNGREYEPVIRASRNTIETVTWGEFIEAGFLTEYRQHRKVPLGQIRTYVTERREVLGVRYPLAHEQPYVSANAELYDDIATDGQQPVYRRASDGQVIFTPWTEDFLDKVEFDANVASAYLPEGKTGFIKVDPVRSFGAPTAGGIRTEALFELAAAGQLIDEIASDFGLGHDIVEAGINYQATLLGIEGPAAA